MTTRPASPPPPRPRLTPLPDPHQPPGMVAQLPHIARALLILGARYRLRSDVLVCGECYIRYDARDLRNSPRPDCLVSFGLTAIPPVEILDARDYNVSEVGKPPDFVLEVTSERTSVPEYTFKRENYARLKVVEYWRFDHTGGRFHDAPLTGERLTADGTYEPIPVYEHPDGTIRGYSAVLELELHWAAGWLRFWDPATGEYLRDLDETTDHAEAQAERANAEAHARQQAEARAAQAEAQLRQLQAQLQRQSPPESQ